MTVWKYILKPTDTNEVEMPKGALPLHVASQFGNDVTIWALVEPGAPKVTRRFRVVGTGHDIVGPAKLHHIGSAIMMNGSLVFHVFEIIE